MPNLNIVTARTDKDQVGDLDEIRASVKAQYPDFRIAKINDLGETWEVVLEKPLDKISERIRTSEFPPPKKDEGGESEESEPSEESDSESEPDGDEEGKVPSDGDGDAPGDVKAEGEGGLKGIEHLVKELLHNIKKLEEKSQVVDDIHKQIAPHVTDGPDLGELGPTAPGGANPGGLGGPPPGGPMGGPPGAGAPGEMPGAKPPVPRRPNVPSGRPDNRMRSPQQRGLPSSFGQHKIVFSPIVQDGYEFTLEDAISAMKASYPNYRVAAVTEERANNRFVGKLSLS